MFIQQTDYSIEIPSTSTKKMGNNNVVMRIIVLLALAQMQVQAFNSIINFSPLKINAASCLRMSGDFEDFQSEFDDGKDLAKEFYKQVKKRENDSNLKQRSQLVSDQQEEYEVKPKISNGKSKKFTGRRGEIDSTGTPSAGLFSSGNGSVYAFPVEKGSSRAGFSSSKALTTKDRMMRDEINFMRVASSEATIVLQGVLVLLLLGFTLYIGSTGGITDGSDRFGALDGMINEFNGLGDSIDFSGMVTDDAAEVPIKEASVWL